MNANERLAAARAAKHGDPYSSLGLWACSQDLTGSDEEVKAMIALQFGFAADEMIDPARVIRLSNEKVRAMISRHYNIYWDNTNFPEEADKKKAYAENDPLIIGKTYALATNGYVLGKYKGNGYYRCPPNAFCACNGALWSFENGDQGDTLWSAGVYQVD